MTTPNFQHLKKTRGFPIGPDETLEALSSPPHHTCYPNPWLKGINSNPSEKSILYSREPYCADVLEGKSNSIYTAHSYHTKTPHRAIMRYVLHYTQPGDVVLDLFSGTGMTGVACSLCDSPDEIRHLGYTVSVQKDIRNRDGDIFSKVGKRKAMLVELSPAAAFISRNQNFPPPQFLEREWSDSWEKINSLYGHYYSTLHDCDDKYIQEAVDGIAQKNWSNKLKEKFGRINYAIWSDVFSCRNCSSEYVYWKEAVDVDNGKVRDGYPCPHCGSNIDKRSSDRVYVTQIDPVLNQISKLPKQVIVSIIYTYNGKRFQKKPDNFDLQISNDASLKLATLKIPISEIPNGDKTPEALRIGYSHFHHFFTYRNLLVFSACREMFSKELLWVATGALMRGSKQHQIAISRVGGEKAGEGGATAGHRRGTLYIPSNQVEMNALDLLEDRFRQTFRARMAIPKNPDVFISTQSACNISQVDDESVDYVFLDPPFGSNIMYSELSFLWESFLGVKTNIADEAIENKSQKKNLDSYRGLILEAFKESFRVLKPGRWITIEFSNTQSCVWNAIQAAIYEAGFVVASVSALDKGRGGLNAIVGQVAVKQDLVINAYKPEKWVEARMSNLSDASKSVWDFVRSHLKNLPVAKARGGEMEFISERDPRILYDRMVAFYVGHCVPVPLSSAEFQAALAEKFPEREGMFFLAEQVTEWDKQRAKMDGVGQMSIFVEDEKSAINWVRQYLNKKPCAYNDITPEFMQQLGASWKKFETRPELSLLLEQNFLKYDGKGEVPSQIHSYLSTQNKDLRNLPKDDSRLQARAKDRWFVPDPAKAVDVESVRNKRLLQEFWELCTEAGIARPTGPTAQRTLPLLTLTSAKKTGRKKLKEVRTEAVRLGFKECFAAKDYATILAIAGHLPANVIEEDEQLQMIHDMAEMRAQG